MGDDVSPAFFCGPGHILIVHYGPVVIIALEERFVRSHGNKPVLVEKQHQSGVFHGGKPVRHGKKGLAGQGFGKGLEDRTLRHAVERRGGLVENEDVGVLDEGAGQRQSLSLSLRELTPRSPILVS